MLLDFITARLEQTDMPTADWRQLQSLCDRIMRYCPRTGETRWETSAWDSVRSDSHQIAFRVGADAVWIQGSPARVCGSGDAVFGEGAAAALDASGCLQRMIAFVCGQLPVELTMDVTRWKVSRIDVTGNLLLNDLPDVRIALRYLRECEGGRYRVSQQAGDTVYWSHKSALRSGKVYAKGPHLRYMVMKKDYTGRLYTESELSLADRLLRLELKLAAQYFRERAGKPWYELTSEDYKREWREYFERMIGEADMKDESDVKQRIMVAAVTEGRGKAAYGCWLLIQAEGWEKAREAYGKSAWYNHLKAIRKAGLGDADISAGKVIPIRRKIIECQMVESWSELLKVA